MKNVYRKLFPPKLEGVLHGPRMPGGQRIDRSQFGEIKEALVLCQALIVLELRTAECLQSHGDIARMNASV